MTTAMSPQIQRYIAKWRKDNLKGKSMSWGELADLTHETQVGIYGFCSCEDNEGNDNPYADCPTIEQRRAWQNL